MATPGQFVVTPMGPGIVVSVSPNHTQVGVRLDGEGEARLFPASSVEVTTQDIVETPLDDTIDLDRLGNPRFLELCAQEVLTHKQKAAGYSGSDNPDTWANFREAESWGLTPVEGCLVRMGDKYRRVQNLRRNALNDQVGESIKDTLLDLSNYAKIAVCLIEEEETAAREAEYLKDKIDTTMRLVGEEIQTGQPLETYNVGTEPLDHSTATFEALAGLAPLGQNDIAEKLTKVLVANGLKVVPV